MANIRQPSLAGGEISPELATRTDLPRHAISLARCNNFIVTPGGSAKNRPGTRIVSTIDGSAVVATRLVPFIYSDTDAYVLVFTANVLRIIKNGAALSSIYGGFSTIATSFAEADLFELKFSQVGDVLHITNPASLGPYTLTRVSETSWVLDGVSWEIPPAYFYDGTPAFVAIGSEAAVPVPTVERPAREWRWKITSIAQNRTTGARFETLPLEVANYATLEADGEYDQGVGALTASGWNFPVYPDKPVKICWKKHSTVGPAAYQPTGCDTYELLGWRIYRGRGDLFGFVGETFVANSNCDFVDVGGDPDYSLQPPAYKDPFAYLDNGVTQFDLPVAVAFYEQRRVYGGSPLRPGRIIASRTNDYANFKTKVGPLEFTTDDDPVELELAAMRREEILNLVGLDRLFAFTTGGVWTVHDIAARSIPVAIKHTDEGCSTVPPVIVSDTLIYVRAKGTGLNALDFSNERGKYAAGDLSSYARHMLEGQEIVSMAYAHDPHRVIWAVRDDGVMLGITYHREFETLAWHQHELSTWAHGAFSGGSGQDKITDVCVIPEGDEDAVYIVTNRSTPGTPGAPAWRTLVERFSTRAVTSEWVGGLTEAFFMDCCVSYTATDQTSFTGLLPGRSYKVLHNGLVLASAYTSSAGGVVDISATHPLGITGTVHVGLSYYSELQTLEFDRGGTDARAKEKIVKAVEFDIVDSRGIQTGERFDNLVDYRQRNVADGATPPLLTTQVSVRVGSTWNKGGVAVLRQSDPLPLCVTGIGREVVLGEK